MTPDFSSPMASVRALTQTIDSAIEDVIDAHDFSFSALSANEAGALLRFVSQTGSTPWHLSLSFPTGLMPQLALQRGDLSAPSLALTVVIDGETFSGLAPALAIAMEMIAAVGGA